MVENSNRYVLQLDGFSDMLESSDDAAVDSLEPELVEIKQTILPSNPVAEETVAEENEIYLRRPQFRVDVESSDVECDSDELLMTSEEADSLLSSR